MTRIRRLVLHLPARMAGIAPSAAREIAERLVDSTYERDGALAALQGPVALADTGQTPAQIGLLAGQHATRALQRGKP